jgi:hypothetical protein
MKIRDLESSKHPVRDIDGKDITGEGFNFNGLRRKRSFLCVLIVYRSKNTSFTINRRRMANRDRSRNCVDEFGL